MVENKSSLFGIIAIIIGASGLGIGAYSVVNFQLVEGPQGPPGNDGLDGINGTNGEDAPGGFIVRILDPNHEEVVSGNITIKALIYGSNSYIISVFRNGTEIGTHVPLEWDTTTVADGWWNLSVKATDLSTNNQSQDELSIYIFNNQLFLTNLTIGGINQALDAWTWGEFHLINFNLDFTANIFVFFNCKLSMSALVWVHMGFRLDDTDYFQLEYYQLGTTVEHFSMNAIYSNVEPGPHKISFYWLFEGSGTQTLSCAHLSTLGIMIAT
ncbi:MAG: collagen-like protein [Promethearchaeota archaeon]